MSKWLLWRRAFAAAQGALDDWFGTVARWTGFGLLLYSLLIDRLKNPALLPAATGLMFLKNVTGGGSSTSPPPVQPPVPVPPPAPPVSPQEEQK